MIRRANFSRNNKCSLFGSNMKICQICNVVNFSFVKRQYFQQLALCWIQENIISFGGNPSRITLFGESAGAASIVAHLIAPGSQGLFKRGILQSGSLDNKWSLDSPQHAMQKSLALARHHGCEMEKVECSANLSNFKIHINSYFKKKF